ncbi:ribosomal protein S18-alanine N-acetyltransferase [Bartonella sp. DGB1]|uniref:ribosomal protein S18-alanine N-acetyltransferase n=1 Tax=Bartonella sp. DGB1 TaxID=3239807 RepID=UPI003523CE25
MRFLQKFFKKSPFIICHSSVHEAKQMSQIHTQLFQEAWDEIAFSNFLQNPNLIAFSSYHLTEPSKIIGFVLTQFITDEAEILSFGIDHNYHKQGLGYKLLQHNIDYLGKKKCRKIFLEVDVNNTAAINLYTKCGFLEKGCRKDYYQHSNSRSDALILEYLYK